MKHNLLPGLGVLIVIVAVLLIIHSCSVIGFSIGAVQDASAPDRMLISGLQVHLLTPGTAVVILKKDAQKLSGKYVGLEPITIDKYAASYTQFRDELNGIPHFPALGDSFYLTIKEKAAFVGFDYGYIVFSHRVKAPLKIIFQNITRLKDSSGNKVDVEPLQKFMSEYKIPCLSEIIIQEEAGRRLVRYDEIASISTPIRKKGKLTGLLIGAVIDVALVIIIVQEMREWSSGSMFD